MVELSRAALRLVLAVDLGQRIRALPTAYLHILNKLADLWSVAAHAERYLEALLLAARVGRQGFPPAVLTQSTLLREKNRRRLAPLKQDVWLQTMLR